MPCLQSHECQASKAGHHWPTYITCINKALCLNHPPSDGLVHHIAVTISDLPGTDLGNLLDLKFIGFALQSWPLSRLGCGSPRLATLTRPQTSLKRITYIHWSRRCSKIEHPNPGRVHFSHRSHNCNLKCRETVVAIHGGLMVFWVASHSVTASCRAGLAKQWIASGIKCTGISNASAAFPPNVTKGYQRNV